MADHLFQEIELRIETLVSTSRKLKEENAFLREMVEALEAELAESQEKQAQARARIEKVLEHLKATDTVDELQ
jgi:uncharacterized protein (TIGR02449 family)